MLAGRFFHASSRTARTLFRGNRYGTATLVLFRMSSVAVRLVGERRFRVVGKVDFAVLAAAMLAGRFFHASSRTARTLFRGSRYGTATLVLFRMSSVAVGLVSERRFRMVSRVEVAVRVFANVAGRFVYAGGRAARTSRLVAFRVAALARAGVPVISTVARPLGRPGMSVFGLSAAADRKRHRRRYKRRNAK